MRRRIPIWFKPRDTLPLLLILIALGIAVPALAADTGSFYRTVDPAEGAHISIPRTALGAPRPGRAVGGPLRGGLPAVPAAGVPAGFVVVLPGETATPAQEPGKTGEPESVLVGQTTPVEIWAIDANWNSIVDFAGSIVLATTDAQAVFPATADLVNGTAVVSVTWMTAGHQTLRVTDQTNPLLTGSAELDVYEFLVPGLKAEYFNNTSLAPPAALIRTDDVVDFQWFEGSPAPEINPSEFSVRWTGEVLAGYSETYEFMTLSDDGVRLWIDDQLVIDNWTEHGETGDAGLIDLEAGRRYSLRMEYFELAGDATARLYWSSASVAMQIIPVDNLSHADLSYSTVDVVPLSLIADNSETATATVSLVNAFGVPVVGEDVYLSVSGRHNWINGLQIGGDEWLNIGQTDAAGHVGASLTSTVAELKTVRARVAGTHLDQAPTIDFRPGQPDRLMILLPGEHLTPGDDPGKGGVARPIVVDHLTYFDIAVVDANWNLADTYDDDLDIGSTDPMALLPSSAKLASGEARVDVTWRTLGPQTLTVTSVGNPSLSDELGFEVVPAPTLVVGNGEVVTVDDARYPVTGLVEVDQSYLPYDGAPGFETGDEVLIIVMQGDAIGTYETAVVSGVQDDRLELQGNLTHAYDGTTDQVMVQRVPEYSAVTVQAGGRITAHAWDGATGGVAFLRAENLSVETGGWIDVSGLGFRAGEGPGSGGLRSGGGHGGYGGDDPGKAGSGGLGYGSALEPVMLASAGGDGDPAPATGLEAGGPGGGLLWLEVSDTLQVEGTLAAGGVSRQAYFSGRPGAGGAGGSIRLRAGTLAGTGSISANGGTSRLTDLEVSTYYGGGSGGRIGISFANNTFTGTWRAYGGMTGSSPGTIFFEDTSLGQTTLRADYAQSDGRPALLTDPETTEWDFDRIELTRNADLEVLDPGDTINLTLANMAGDGTGQIHLHYPVQFTESELRRLGLYIHQDGELSLPPVFSVRGAELSVYGTLRGLEELTLATDGAVNPLVRLSAAGHSDGQAAGTFQLESVVVHAGGKLELASDGEAERGLTLLASALAIDAGGQVSGDGLGFQIDGYRGPGAGTSFGGAGHGGFGGGSGGGIPYGSALEPVALGSAGGGAGAGAGGGAIHMVVDALRVDGILSSDGKVPARYGGGGAGGSLWLEVGSLSGSGVIRATGGHNYVYSSTSGSGAGGRISLAYATSTFSGTLEAAGGLEKNMGGPGTIVLKDVVSGSRVLRVDNLGRAGRQAGLTDPLPTVWTFAEVMLVGRGDLELLDADDTLLVTADNTTGDGTAQLSFNGSLSYPDNELSGFGLQPNPGAILTLPASFILNGASLTNLGTIQGLSDMTVRGGTFVNRGVLDPLASLILAAGSQKGIARLSAEGNTAGQPPGTYEVVTVMVPALQRLELEGDAATGTGVTLRSDEVTIEATGRISADSLGYRPGVNRGPGYAGPGKGSAHGGFAPGDAGTPYGSALRPIDLGSAGGEDATIPTRYPGAAGGGAIHILAGSVRIDGTLSANGGQADYHHGSGTGGSLWIEASSLFGVGRISANGGTSLASAGGRIAIYAATNGFTGQIEAAGGPEAGAGTIYLEDTTTGQTRLVVDNLGRPGAAAALTDPETTAWDFDIVDLVGSGKLQLLDPEDSILLTNDNMQGDGSGQFVIADQLDLGLSTLRGFGFYVRPGASLTLPSVSTIEGVPLTNEGTLLGATELTLRAGRFSNLGTMPHLSSLTLQVKSGSNSMARLSASGETAGEADGTYLIDTVQIDNGQTLELAADAANLNGLTLQVTNITVAGHLSADGLGYRSALGSRGPGAPIGWYGGAGHGGRGGGTEAGSNAGGLGYGSVSEPTSLGSAAGGAGGGAIRLIASQTVFVPALGVISADGLSSGGAGGSLWITANSLQGSGVLRANGGDGNADSPYLSSGAGGRIAIHTANNTFNGRIEARGGAGVAPLPWVPRPAGGAGTIYLVNAISGANRLVVDNGGLPGQWAILTDPAATHWTFDRIELRARGDLELSDPDDTIELSLLNMFGDGTAQVSSHGLLSYSASEIRGFGLHAYPGATLSLPTSLTVRQVAVTNEGAITGLSALTLRGGQYVNRGAMPDLRSLTLRAEGSVNSLAQFVATGSSGGRPAAEYSLGEVRVEANQVLEFASDPIAGIGPTLRAKNLTVAGHLSADKLGYRPRSDLGPGPGAPTIEKSGAGHGGRGGGSGGGPTYGSADEPTTLGSASSAGGAAGDVAGGGAVRILVEGTLDVPAGGRLSANGGAAIAVPWFNGGGSGGSLWITAPSVQGAGTIEASGGPGLGGIGGGGGGRVKLEAGFVSLDLTIQALGGPGTAPGEAGSAIVESIGFPTDVAVAKSALPEAVPGRAFEYGLVVRNDGLTKAEAVTLVDTLPSEVTYVSDNAPVPVAQSGATLTWAFGDLLPGQTVAFSVAVRVSDTAVVGTDLLNQASVSTATNEIDLQDNSRETTTRLTTGYAFEAELMPASQSLNLDAAGSYRVLLRNTGVLADRYTVEVSGLPSAWFSLSASEVPLAPGGEAEVTLSILVQDCSASGSHSFQVTVTPSGAAPAQALNAQLTLASSVAFSDLRPAINETVGSRDVLFAWRTDVAAVSTLRLYPAGRPAEERVFTTSAGLVHSIQVAGLERSAVYEWQVQAASTCGVGSASLRRFTVGNGIAFTQREISISINRDYDQRATVQIRNEDSLPHTVRLEIQHPYPDLFVNFIGSGSIDEVITLVPGERRTVTLAVHAQDATQHQYDLTAVLTADEASDPIRDTARIHVTVLFDADFTLEEVAVHPISGVRTYRVRNDGSAITDLAIRAVDPSTGLPAQALIIPAVNHAFLRTGESLTFQVHPLFGPEDLSAGAGESARGQGLAAPTRLGEPYDIVATVGGAIRRLQASRSCPSGTQLFPVTRQNVVLSFPASDKYCTNNPNFTLPIDIPAFLRQSSILGGALQATFYPAPGIPPHWVQIAVNGTTVLAPPYGVPTGTYTGIVPAGAIRSTSLAGTTTQVISLTSQHPNPGHYLVVTDFVLRVAASEITVYVCATSQQEAEQIFDEMYNPQPLPTDPKVFVALPVGGIQYPDANGYIQVQAHVSDDLEQDPGYYAVNATVEYLDLAAPFSETFPLFNDGPGGGHGDGQAGDDFYNALWRPQAAGRVQLTIELGWPGAQPGAPPITDSVLFIVELYTDLAVTRVFTDILPAVDEPAEVIAEITNLGAATQKPVLVEFAYYEVNRYTGDPEGSPKKTSQCVLFGSGEIFPGLERVFVVDESYVQDRIGYFFALVRISLDPPGVDPGVPICQTR